MEKKLVKVRTPRTDTLEAMGSNCSCTCDCTNCSGGGSFTIEKRNYSLISSMDHESLTS